MGRSYNPEGGGVQPFQGQEILSAFQCPPLSANTNDFTIARRPFADSSIIELSATVPINLTGLQGATLNRVLTVLVGAGSSAITLTNEDAASQAKNRFNLGASVTLLANQALVLLGLGAAGWALRGAAPSTAGGAPSTATYVTTTDESGPLPDSKVLGLATASGACYGFAAGQSLTDSAFTAIALDTPQFDTAAYFADANPTRLTAPVAGLYLVTASLAWAVATTGSMGVLFQKNGVAGTYYGFDNSSFIALESVANSLSFAIQLAAGDYMELVGLQTSGAPLAVRTDDGVLGHFSMLQLH
jgi:hypothetical protein